MIRIRPLPLPRKPVPPVSLKPSAGRTPFSRRIRSGAAKPEQRSPA